MAYLNTICDLINLFWHFRICVLVIVPRSRAYDMVLSIEWIRTVRIWSFCSDIFRSSFNWYSLCTKFHTKQMGTWTNSTGICGQSGLIPGTNNFIKISNTCFWDRSCNASVYCHSLESRPKDQVNDLSLK